MLRFGVRRMTKTVSPPTVSLIPETAPFSPEQRAWLNGFFAGYLDLTSASITPLSAEDSAKLMAGVAPTAKGSPDDSEDGEAPWHDPSLPMQDRMKLAEGRPLRRRMMAAMAQQDCGQCGYNCQDYSNALFARKEERLNLCVPGGKETSRTLKALYQELGTPPPSPSAPATTSLPAATTTPAADA